MIWANLFKVTNLLLVNSGRRPLSYRGWYDQMIDRAIPVFETGGLDFWNREIARLSDYELRLFLDIDQQKTGFLYPRDRLIKHFFLVFRNEVVMNLEQK